MSRNKFIVNKDKRWDPYWKEAELAIQLKKEEMKLGEYRETLPLDIEPKGLVPTQIQQMLNEQPYNDQTGLLPHQAQYGYWLQMHYVQNAHGGTQSFEKLDFRVLSPESIKKTYLIEDLNRAMLSDRDEVLPILTISEEELRRAHDDLTRLRASYGKSTPEFQVPTSQKYRPMSYMSGESI